MLLRNFFRSTSSLAKDCTTRIPARVSCRLAFTSPIFLRLSMKVACIREFCLAEKKIINSTRASRGTASLALIINRQINDPTILIREMNRFSGPWWANSAMSNRSETSLLIICPELLLS